MYPTFMVWALDTAMENEVSNYEALERPFCFAVELEAGKGHGAPAITASISHVSRGQFVRFLHPCAVTYCSKEIDC
jgi:hypothetical protein